jgi:hypothetical protein
MRNLFIGKKSLVGKKKTIKKHLKLGLGPSIGDRK